MEFYIPTDLAMAGNNAWVAAVAALAEREVGAVLPCFKDFELREWTDVRGMKQAMAASAPKMGVREFMWPSPHEFGKPKGLNWWMPLEAQIQEMVAADSLVLVQWLGPWTARDFRAPRALKYTHWIATRGGRLFDPRRPKRWRGPVAWDEKLRYALPDLVAGSTGWWPKHQFIFPRGWGK